MKNKNNLFQKVPGFKSQEPNNSHRRHFDLEVLKITRDIKDIQISSASPNSPISEIFPLARSRNSFNFILTKKNQDYIRDLQNYPLEKNIDRLWGDVATIKKNKIVFFIKRVYKKLSLLFKKG